MSRVSLPNAAPLPEVSRHTDDIVFGGLGLPVGFDQDRLLINLRAMDRFRKVAGLDVIRVVAESGESEAADPQITGVDDHGVATMGFAAKRHKQPLGSGSLQWPVPGVSSVGRPAATVKVNNTELETRLEEKPEKYKKGAFDAEGRATFLNQAIKHGLSTTNREASLNKNKILVSGAVYGFNGALFAGGFYSLPLFLLNGPISNVLIATRNAFHLAKDDPESFLPAFKEHRFSLFYGVNPDRYVAAQGVLVARKLIKPRS